jgi:hypothetical protein
MAMDGAVVGIEAFVDDHDGRLAVRGCIKTKCVAVAVNDMVWDSQLMTLSVDECHSLQTRRLCGARDQRIWPSGGLQQ